MPDWNELIEEGHPGGLCPLCDNAIEGWHGWSTVTAHNTRYMVHQMCVDAEEDEDQSQ